MRELTRARDRKILGVAGGFAEYFDMDKTLWRALWVLICIAMPPAVLAYFILGFVMPEAPVPPAPAAPEADEQPKAEPVYTRNSYKPLTKSREKWLAGVCGGVAEYFEVDPVVVRALWLAAVFAFGTGLALYIILAILMPQPAYQPR